MNWDRFRDPDLDAAWRGDDEEEPDVGQSAVSDLAAQIDEHRRRVEWSSPRAVWGDD